MRKGFGGEGVSEAAGWRARDRQIARSAAGVLRKAACRHWPHSWAACDPASTSRDAPQRHGGRIPSPGAQPTPWATAQRDGAQSCSLCRRPPSPCNGGERRCYFDTPSPSRLVQVLWSPHGRLLQHVEGAHGLRSRAHACKCTHVK
jgi:hypothetical protein